MGEMAGAAWTGFKRGLGWLRTPFGIAALLTALIIGAAAGVLTATSGASAHAAIVTPLPTGTPVPLPTCITVAPSPTGPTPQPTGTGPTPRPTATGTPPPPTGPVAAARCPTPRPTGTTPLPTPTAAVGLTAEFHHLPPAAKSPPWY